MGVEIEKIIRIYIGLPLFTGLYAEIFIFYRNR